MGSMSIFVGEVVAPTSSTNTSTSPADAPTSPAEAPTASAARGGKSTLMSATGGEVTMPSTVPHGGVAVHASSTSASPKTCGSGDLVREGDDGATDTSCGHATSLHGKVPHQDPNHTISERHNQPSGFYLITVGSQVFSQNTRGLIAPGIFACAAAALRCASNPRRSASSDVFCTSSRCLLAPGLSGLLAAWSSGTGNSSMASTSLLLLLLF
jgi:hypothetical protein